MNRIFYCMFLAGLALACAEEDAGCVRGEIIAKSCCSGTTFVNLEGSDLGMPVMIGDKRYENAIQIMGYYDPGMVFLDLRAPDPERDGHPIALCYCLCPVSWSEVPLYVAESVSTTGCSIMED